MTLKGCLFILLSILFFGCSSKLDPEKSLNNVNTLTDSSKSAGIPVIEEVSLTDPFETKTIKVLITNHFNTYYIYRGQEFGLEFELLQQYLKYKGWKLEFEMVHDMSHVHDSLLTKGTHLAAASFVYPVFGNADGLYSDYLYNTDLVLVQNKDKGVKKPSKEAPLTTTIVREATYISNFFRDSLEPRGIKYQTLDRGTTKQELIEQVANNQIESTICSRYEADIMFAFYPNLSYDEIILRKTPISFLFHPKAEALQKDFNQWLYKHRNTSDFQWIVKKYESFPKELARNMKYINPVVLKDKISGYDKLVQTNAEKIGWDWKLLSALIYQESQFNPRCESWVGAKGLMQVMPSVGKEHGKLSPNQLLIPEKNVRVGASYLAWIENNFYKEKEISDIDKVKFVLASYNAGVGHVADARALARKHGLNPNVWDENVEKMILAKSYAKYYRDPVCKHGYCRGRETATYVDHIIGYYGHYATYIEVD